MKSIIKIVITIVILIVLFRFFSQWYANRYLNKFISPIENEITFWASLSPTLCELENINQIVKSNDGLIEFTYNSDNLLNSLGIIDRILKNSLSFDQKSESLKMELITEIDALKDPFERFKKIKLNAQNLDIQNTLLNSAELAYYWHDYESKLQLISTNIEESFKRYFERHEEKMKNIQIEDEGIYFPFIFLIGLDILGDSNTKDIKNKVSSRLLELSEKSNEFLESKQKGCLNGILNDLNLAVNCGIENFYSNSIKTIESNDNKIYLRTICSETSIDKYEIRDSTKIWVIDSTKNCYKVLSVTKDVLFFKSGYIPKMDGVKSNKIINM